MNRSTPGLSVHHHLPEFTQTDVHQVGETSSHLILCRPLLLPPIPPSIRVFSKESTLRMRWPKYGASASASFLLKKSQGWSPLEWTGWISLKSKGLSRVSSSTTVSIWIWMGTSYILLLHVLSFFFFHFKLFILYFFFILMAWKKSCVQPESESCSVMSDSSLLQGLYSPWNSPGQNTWVGSLSLLQGIFPTQGSTPGLLHCR